MKYFILSLFVATFAMLNNFDGPRRSKISADQSFQKSEFYRTVSLNYTTMMSSLLWIRSMIGYGEDLRNKKRNPNIIENGLVLASLDPGFKKPYEWFPAIPLGSQNGPDFEDFEKIDELMTIGMEYHDDPSINYSAALNHIGYNRNLDDHQKKYFYKKAAGFLKPVLGHPKGAPLLTPIYSYLRKGGHFRTTLDPNEEVELIVSLILTTSREGEQKAWIHRLNELGYQSAAFDRKLAYQKEYKKKKNECCAYYSDELSLAYGF